MFWVSAALAVAAALVYFLQVDIPAYVILALANIVRGL
jgi:hypothetical protein